MKKYILILFVLRIATSLATAQSTNYNYVKSTVFLEADQSRKITSVSYSDALGRPIQDVLVGASPIGYDIVLPYEYDALGRQVKSYLPYTTYSNGTGNIQAGALAGQANYYSAHFSGQKAYAEVQFDGSPHNRVFTQMAVGDGAVSTADFEPAGIGIAKWKVNSATNALERDGTYADNSLLKYTSAGPNNKKVQIWKNKSGQVLIKAEDPDGINARTVMSVPEIR